jgi:trehalose 6-phosphate phosphatase
VEALAELRTMSSQATTKNIKLEAGTSLEDSAWLDSPPPSPESLLEGDIANLALFLDCDGTLLDIAQTPNEVRVPPGLVALIERVSRGLDGALAVLTGRQLAEIDVLLSPAQPLGAGVHGAEMRTSRGAAIVRVASALPASLVDHVMRRVQALPGIIAEPKGPGLAVHYRLAPHLKDILEAELRVLLTQYPDGLVLSPGRKLFEIIPAGHSKGTALRALYALPQFAGRRPIMIGDDLGDIPAFAAARQLGGAGLRVGGEQFGHDNVELTGPAQTIAWLQLLAEKLKV